MRIIAMRTIELENLCTLIINEVGFYTPLEEVLESMFKRMRKLRVLLVGLIRQARFSLPENIGLLKHLRFLALRMGGPSCQLEILPRSFSKLYHMQTLDFGDRRHLLSGSREQIVNLVNLRYASSNLCDHLNISRSTSLQKFAFFSVSMHKLKELGDINKIRGSLHISDLNLVESMEDALEAKLADKSRLTKLELSWWGHDANPQVEAEVLEGLCPPTCLEELRIEYYSGATYPNWMVDKQSDGPKGLQNLELTGCSRMGPELFHVFTRLRSFSVSFCSMWEALPDTIVLLKSLEELNIYECMSIRSLPVLPQSVKMFRLKDCDEAFMMSCQTIGDTNWQKIQHIATREFHPSLSSSPTNSNRLKGTYVDPFLCLYFLHFMFGKRHK
jgi:hypothetical protein